MRIAKLVRALDSYPLVEDDNLSPLLRYIIASPGCQTHLINQL
jgi:hypothetical protein